MEDFKTKDSIRLKDKEIVYSKSIKAGKRIYYLDVKRNRKDELFLAITESKKIVSDSVETQNVQYEKHKIFLYKEDFNKFVEGLQDVLDYINNENGKMHAGKSSQNCFLENQTNKITIEDLV